MTAAMNRISPMVAIPYIMEAITINTKYLFPVTNRKRRFNKEKILNSCTNEETQRYINNAKISDNLFAEIERMSGGDLISRMNFTQKGVEANQWIRFAIYYLTDPNATQILFADKECREFVNGICALGGFDKIYEDEGIANIDLYDSTKANKEYCGRFLVYKQELVDFLATPFFQAAVKRKLMQQTVCVNDSEKYLPGSQGCANPAFDLLNNSDNEIVHPVFTVCDDNEEAIHPISFGSIEKEEVPKMGANMPIHVYTQFEEVFTQFIPELVPYRYECVNGIYYLFITRFGSGAEEFYILDDGTIMGGHQVSVLATYLQADGSEKYMFVNIEKHPAIGSKLLSKALFNYLTPDEVEMCRVDYLIDKTLYNNFDFQNTRFFDYLSPQDKWTFEVVLLGILKLADAAQTRMRFESFTDVTHFTLVSDPYMYRPFNYIQDHILPEVQMINGLRISVDGNNYIVQYGDNVKRFTWKQ